MVERIIELSARHRWVVFAFAAALSIWAVDSIRRTPLDAVPDLGMSGRQRIPVAGEIPNPINPPTGCTFNPRCPFANDRCRSERPELIGGVACHAVQEGRIEVPAAA